MQMTNELKTSLIMGVELAFILVSATSASHPVRVIGMWAGLVAMGVTILLPSIKKIRERRNRRLHPQ